MVPTFAYASHADSVVAKYGFPPGVVRMLCAIARIEGFSTGTSTQNECGPQLTVWWLPEPRVFACEVFDGRIAGGKQLERFNVR